MTEDIATKVAELATQRKADHTIASGDNNAEKAFSPAQLKARDPGNEQEIKAFQVNLNPTVQRQPQGVAINDDPELEREADMMGQKALQAKLNASDQ